MKTGHSFKTLLKKKFEINITLIADKDGVKKFRCTMQGKYFVLERKNIDHPMNSSFKIIERSDDVNLEKLKGWMQAIETTIDQGINCNLARR